MSLDVMRKAVESRDTRADGLFVYAVTSTGVYCRPSCPSRRPRPDRVEFFPTPALAESSGFRACRRCHPQTPLAETPSTARVRRACVLLANASDGRWSTPRLAREVGVSPVQLQRAFRSALGLSPQEYVAACRRRRFLSELRAGTRVTDAVYASGYGSSSRVYGALHLSAMTPATYGRGGRNAKIDWLTIATPVGRVLVAATAKGLCFVEVGADNETLLAALRHEFPEAEISTRPAARLRPFAAAAHGVATATEVRDDLPLDVRATAFQWRVWRALTRIPRGATRTYAEVARSLGTPGATRAVARACATNPVALVVPCHRVVGSGGAMRGYRWGVEVKRQLLEIEKVRSTKYKVRSTARRNPPD